MSSALGLKLKQYRAIKGLTLRNVEEKTKISNGYLNQIENGHVNNPSPNYLKKLADLYRVKYETLMRLAGYYVPNNSKTTKKNAGIAFSLLEDLTQEEEEELLKYLGYYRQMPHNKK